MPHGQPDYGMYALASTIYRLADMGELAVRLGSIVTFDRRGDVVWMDDFESGLGKWDRGFVGSGGFIRIDGACPKSGILSVAMQPPTAETAQAYIDHRQPYTHPGKLGLEVSWSIAYDSGPVYVDWAVLSSTCYLRGGIRYEPVADVLMVWDKDFNWVTIDDAPVVNTVFRTYHTWKLVVDTDNKCYVRALLDDGKYDISGIPIYDGGPTNESYMRVRLIEVGGSVAKNYAYWDDVIITQNEP